MPSQSKDRRPFCRSLVVAAAAAIAVVLTSSTVVSAQRHLDVIHEFAPAPGVLGQASLIQATDGNFYGTTRFGFAGTIFKMTPGGTLTILHSFAGAFMDGANPQAALVQATDGNFYGTTAGGGTSDSGTVFKMTAAGTVTILHSFNFVDGRGPSAALIQGTDGNFYGTTASGGASGSGTISP